MRSIRWLPMRSKQEFEATHARRPAATPSVETRSGETRGSDEDSKEKENDYSQEEGVP